MYKLLIVDDEQIEREGMAHFIQWDKYDIQLCGTAWNGADALGKIQKDVPDIVLTDIKMPVMDGLEATRRIRLKGGTLPIIALTANAYDSDRDKAFEAGCDDYMAKPIMAPALREMIEKYFGK